MSRTGEIIADVFARFAIGVVVPFYTIFDCVRVPLEKGLAT
jgi:hypothetical protein